MTKPSTESLQRRIRYLTCLLIVGLVAILTVSYRQTIFAYPSGGGAYIVAKSNLGEPAGLVAAAALLIDYVLTVAVSVAADDHWNVTPATVAPVASRAMPVS